MDSRYAIKRNQMRQRTLSTELENIDARLEGRLYLIEHEVSEIKKDQEKHSEPESKIDLSYLKRKSEFDAMDSSRRRTSSFSNSETHSSNDSLRRPNVQELRRDSISKAQKTESPVGQYNSSPIPHSYVRSRRMSLPANFVNSFEPFGGLRGSKGSGSSVNKWSDSSLKRSHGDVRKSRDSITKSRDNSPEIEKYANQMRRLKRELNQRKPKTIKQLEKMPLTSTEETHLIKYLREEERKQLTEKRNAELFEGLKKCNYLRTNHPEELSVDEILDRSHD